MPRTPCAQAVNEEWPFDTDKYAAGDRISDKYRLETPLGFGAMGVLWRAHNEMLDVPVALKLIRRDARWSWSSERLLFEARVMASLRHSAIVRVFDYGMTTRRDPFIVMELLQGETLRDLLEREKSLSAVEALRLMLPILEGLDCAHARNIVHRDLKPENIFLSRDDRGRIQPKLLDFGIAKLEGAAFRLTTGGIVLGSPSYMSPEQAEGEEGIDSRVDVWAAAVVLYEMIAGHEPWDANNCPALLHAIVHHDAPPIAGTGGVDAHLWSILELGLAKKRENRWKSCRDFGWALADWLATRSVADDVTGTSLSNAWLALGPNPPSPLASADDDNTRTAVRVPRFKLALFAFLAASLVFVGLRLPNPSAEVAPASPPALVQPMITAIDAPPRSEATLADRPAPSETPAATAPVRPRPKGPAATRGKPAASATSAPQVPSPPAVWTNRRKSAQEMDFGF